MNELRLVYSLIYCESQFEKSNAIGGPEILDKPSYNQYLQYKIISINKNTLN